eukprot:TRINITY_DN2583_c0_g1_i3.p1 TRINITY_DN2583_c0_g1~~TRINITY_DN2583_c0_g1_i3.p1  ORF type:complete len:251 (-),score=43.73 TRINITY_DN2583_c0_g1_i3:853-1605(-)
MNRGSPDGDNPARSLGKSELIPGEEGRGLIIRDNYISKSFATQSMIVPRVTSVDEQPKPKKGDLKDQSFIAVDKSSWADSKACRVCQVKFSLTEREHHCRSCGAPVCGNCSKSTINKHRACDFCVFKKRNAELIQGWENELRMREEAADEELRETNDEINRLRAQRIRSSSGGELGVEGTQNAFLQEEEDQLKAKNSLKVSVDRQTKLKNAIEEVKQRLADEEATLLEVNFKVGDMYTFSYDNSYAEIRS